MILFLSITGYMSCLSLMTSSLFLFPVATCKPLVLSTSSCSLLLFYPKPTKLGQHFHLVLHTALTNVMNYGIFCGFYNTVSTILSFLYFFFVTEYCYIMPAGLDHPPASGSQALDCRQVLGKHLASAFSLEGVGHETGG